MENKEIKIKIAEDRDTFIINLIAEWTESCPFCNQLNVIRCEVGNFRDGEPNFYKFGLVLDHSVNSLPRI